MIDELLLRLEPKARRGSKARCHLMTPGNREEVAQRLTQLCTPWGIVDASDAWMPQGFERTDEAQLGRNDILVDKAIGKALIGWWLAVPRRAKIPNWDIASTCKIDGKKGLLLVEAKAYDKELTFEQAGKRKGKNESENSQRNRAQITDCIRQANQALGVETRMSWFLSIDHQYQMSNRFAWAWKLTEFGIPVILVYLGFLRADEMNYRGIPFRDEASWKEMVILHSKSLFPEKVWNQQWAFLKGQAFIPLIRTIELPLE